MTGLCAITGSVSPVESGLANLCGGTKTYTWTYTDACNRTITHVQNFTATIVPIAAFQNPPGDQTVTCANIPVSVPDLNYTNGLTGNCEISGTAQAAKTGNSDLCGGTTTYTWTYTDACNRVITHVQNINATPVPIAVFQNPPASQTVACENIPTGAQDLSYTNGLTGNCAITGTVPAVLIGNPSICGGTFSYQWQFTDACNRIIAHTQNYTVIPTPVAAFVSPPQDIASNCKDVVLNAPPLNYTNGKGGLCGITGSVQPTVISNYNECGGTVEFLWDYTDACNRVISHTQTVTVNPSPQAAFQSPPADITVQCESVPQLDVLLNYTNGGTAVCAIAGGILPDVNGSHDECGGDYTQTWTFTDNCNRTINHNRKIKVLPAPLPIFTNPPVDITVDCTTATMIDQTALLQYTNNKTGQCQNSGDVEAITTGSFDPCGGNLKRNWILNTCGSIVKHVQNIKVLPAPEPMFLNPPLDITLDCGEPFPSPDDLFYTNNKSDECEISGFVSPDQFLDKNVMTYTWEFSNPCSNKKITKVQKITGNPVPDIFLNPSTANICLGSSYNLNNIVVTDNSKSNPTISFHTGTPATLANKLSSTVVMPTTSTTYYILASASGCTDEESFLLKVDTALVAGGDGSGTICFGATGVNLFSYLTGNYSKNGAWKNKGTGNINLFDPTMVSFSNALPGNFGFYYIVPKVGACPADTASVTLTLKPEIVINIDSLDCTSDQNNYIVYLNSSGYNITTSIGSVTNLGNSKYSAGLIPVVSPVTITATEASSGCKKDFPINPPNCSCPNVDAPISGGNKIICFGDAIPTLTVMVSIKRNSRLVR